MRRILSALLLSLLGACRLPLPAPWPPPVPSATATPGPAASPTPTAQPTATPTPEASRTPTPTPSATPTPEAVEIRQLTSGRAVFELDLSGFEPAADLDVYAFATACLQEPTGGPLSVRPTTPCVQLGLRGSLAEPCERKPCDGRQALEVRYSANLRYDGQPGRSEASMCGSGTRPPQWVPLGPGPRVLVTLEWGPGYIRARTPAGEATLTQGAAGPGFGWVSDASGPALGIGWVYRREWTLQAHGGRARLLSWEAVGEQPPLASCP